MRAALLLSSVVASGCLLIQGPVKPTLAPQSLAPRKTVTAEALSLTLPTHPGGQPWSVEAQRGRVVLLDVWATWCEPCRDALPLYQDLQKEFGARGLEVVTVNIDADAHAIDPFLADARLALPVLRDPEAHVSESALKVKLMPTAFLIDRKGVIRHVHEGFDEGELSAWLSEIEQLLAEPAAP